MAACGLASPQSKQAAATPKRNTYNLTSAERCHLAPLFRVIKFRVNAFLGAPPSKVVFEAAECDVWLRYMCPRPCRAGTEIHQPASVGLVVLTINLILEPGVKLNRGCWTPGNRNYLEGEEKKMLLKLFAKLISMSHVICDP